jgi:ribonuclease HI
MEMKKIIVYTDGGARGNPGNAGVGVVVTDTKRNILKQASKALGIATNNMAEYEAVIVALDVLKKLFKDKTKEMEFEFRMDSQLVQRQLIGQYKVKDQNLQTQFSKAFKIIKESFPNISFNHIMREENNLADGLANEAMDRAAENA